MSMNPVQDAYGRMVDPRPVAMVSGDAGAASEAQMSAVAANQTAALAHLVTIIDRLDTIITKLNNSINVKVIP